MTGRPSSQELADRVREERRTRHMTIPQLREEFGQNWPWESGRIRSEADDAVDALVARLQATEQALRDYDDWASRMPDAGFTSESPRWDWWHERPYELARRALEGAAE